MCVCVCVCVCVQTEGDVLAGSFHTQAASTISEMMIFNIKNESGSQKQVTQTQTPRQRDAHSSLPLHFCCSTEHSKKGRTKMRHLKTGPRNIGRSQNFHTGAEHSSVHSIHPNCIYFNQFIQTLTKLLPRCCFDLDINYARWLSVYLCDMCQRMKPFAMMDLLCTST